MFRALLSAGGGWAVGLAVIGGVNSVIALYYYANVARKMWMEPAPDGDATPIRVPQSLSAALVITAVRHRRSSACCPTSCCASAT